MRATLFCRFCCGIHALLGVLIVMLMYSILEAGVRVSNKKIFCSARSQPAVMT